MLVRPTPPGREDLLALHSGAAGLARSGRSAFDPATHIFKDGQYPRTVCGPKKPGGGQQTPVPEEKAKPPLPSPGRKIHAYIQPCSTAIELNLPSKLSIKECLAASEGKGKSGYLVTLPGRQGNLTPILNYVHYGNKRASNLLLPGAADPRLSPIMRLPGGMRLATPGVWREEMNNTK